MNGPACAGRTNQRQSGGLRIPSNGSKVDHLPKGAIWDRLWDTREGKRTLYRFLNFKCPPVIAGEDYQGSFQTISDRWHLGRHHGDLRLCRVRTITPS